MVSLENLPQSDRLIFLIACSFIILAGLKMAGGFIGPFLLSVFAAVIFSVVSLWFQKRGFTPRLSSYLAFFIFLGCLTGVAVMALFAVSPLIEHIPKIESGIISNIGEIDTTLSKFGFKASTIIPASQMTGSLGVISPDMVTSVIGQVSALFIVLFTTLFLLLEATLFSQKISNILGSYRQELANRITEFSSVVIEYVFIRTKVNIVTGAGFGIILFFIGVQDPLVWGLLMFVLNFVPYIGFIFALIPPLVLALVDISPYAALLVVIFASLVNLFSENFIFPELAGRSMSLSPAIVFISMIFWGYFLGGAGVLVAIPLTVLLKMILESYPETRPLATIIGSGLNDTDLEKV